jgi:uncharacterized damage-inducible protein DinB
MPIADEPEPDGVGRTGEKGRAMNEEVVLRLINVGEHVAQAGHWVTPVAEALDGVTAAEAAWKPAPDERSIGEIVAHMTVWTLWCVRFLRGQDTEVTEWPPVSGTDDASWDADRDALLSALRDFQAALAALDPSTLFDAPTPAVTPTDRFTGISSILVHNAYHTGQIVKLREAAAAVVGSR